ncbi:hypothetical protein DFJ74DRAFT_700521 [Hyaloraphidium curvatum]|nr:hypothetical protein DFJ74DRAFT_700521 [Hyaloraphidium curvatum]
MDSREALEERAVEPGDPEEAGSGLEEGSGADSGPEADGEAAEDSQAEESEEEDGDGNDSAAEADPEEPEEREPGSIMEEIWRSVMTPGVPNSRVQMFFNFIFVLLFLSLGALFVVSGYSLHVVVLIAAAVGLFGSVQWFLQEAAMVEEAAKEAERRKRSAAKDAEDKEGGESHGAAEGKKTR